MEDWPIEGLLEELTLVFGNLPFSANSLKGSEFSIIKGRVEELHNDFLLQVDKLESNEDFQYQLRNMYLQTLDRSWIAHMELLFQMREGIGIRGYGQEDPYRLYEREAYDEFLHYLAELDALISKQAKTYVQHFFDL